MSNLKNIIVHCSDSSFGNTNEIREWHLKKGWRDIGYHFVIFNGFIFPETEATYHIKSLDGSIECGRPLNADNLLVGDEIGAHTLGYNDDSIGVCLIGKKIFTNSQMQSLNNLLHDLCRIYKISIDCILGHCETDSGKEQRKSCPNLDVSLIRAQLKTHFDII